MVVSWHDVWNLRAGLYQMLGEAMLEVVVNMDGKITNRHFWEDFPLTAANTHMETALENLKNCLIKLEKLPDGHAERQLAIEYTELFLGPARPKAPPWESVYRTSEKSLFGWSTFQVREILSENGLQIREKFKQPEDHIGYELLLLAAMSDKLLRLSDELEKQHCVEQQRVFIEEHLLAWIPEFSKDVAAHSATGFYGNLVQLIWGILLWDCELLAEYSSVEK